MSQQELLKHVIQVLDRAAIDYMVTGSVASSLQGEARASHDIDLVVALQDRDIPKLLVAFPSSDYYLSEAAVRDAVGSRSMFNLLAFDGGDKVDFWMLSDSVYDRARFARKYVEDVLGMKLKVSAPEDTILMKLRWSKDSGGSEKQLTDALRVFEVQKGKLDLRYIETWAAQLGILESWTELQARAGD